MKARVLAWLACPMCSAPLRAMSEGGWVSGELVDGHLVCQSGHRFSVTQGIPRLLPNASSLRHDRRTQAAFGYEWSRFADYQLPNFRTIVMPGPDGWCEGRLGLDAGCGAGRHLVEAARGGAEMVGVDQSHAVDIAQARAAAMPKVHVIQADLRSLPFQAGQFDFIYSWGVLHHLPNPEGAFHRLLPYLKPGGLIVIGVYQATLRKRLLELPRLLTTRLPLACVRVIASSAAALDYGGVILPYRWLRRLTGPRLDRYVPSHVREYARYPFRVSETDWFDRLAAPITHWYTREEIERWFQRAKLINVEVRSIEDFWWRGAARKPS